MNTTASATARRGACPGLSAPMQTGDGLLVRLTLLAGISPNSFIGLCAAAREHGNGTLEITARGSLQVRGLRPDSAARFAAAIGALALPLSEGIPVLTDPLGDQEPDAILDTAALASQLRQAVAAAGLALAPKVSVALDGGGRLHLDAVPADVRLRVIGSARGSVEDVSVKLMHSGETSSAGLPLPQSASKTRVNALMLGEGWGEGVVKAPLARICRPLTPTLSPEDGGEGEDRAPGDGPTSPEHALIAIAVGGDAASATPLGSLPLAAAVAATVRILDVIAARGAQARAVDVLHHDGLAVFRSAIDGDLGPAHTMAPRPPAEPLGRHLLRDGSVAVGIAPAFGQAQAETLIALTRIAAANGVRSMRPTPGRTLLMLGATTEAAATLAEAAAQLGFITRADDARRRVVACPGRPACASGMIAARALAVEIAQALPPGGDLIHVSGCAKGCAHPAAATMTIVGTERGCGIIRHGSARAAPCRHVATADLVAEIARLAEATDELVHG